MVCFLTNTIFSKHRNHEIKQSLPFNRWLNYCSFKDVGKTLSFTQNANCEDKLMNTLMIECSNSRDDCIHIDSAKYSCKDDSQTYSDTKILRQRCNNKKKCKYNARSIRELNGEDHCEESVLEVEASCRCNKPNSWCRPTFTPGECKTTTSTTTTTTTATTTTTTTTAAAATTTKITTTTTISQLLLTRF